MAGGRHDMESWRNVSAGTHFINRLDHRGEMTRVEMVESGKTFHLSPEERRINSEKAATADLDVFRNGFFEPVRLLDDSEEARELAANPNIMSESDMRALVKIHPKTFEAKLHSITNSTTLERMMAVARDEDVTVKRMDMIRARLDEVTAPVSVGGDRSPFGRPVSPR